MDINSINTILIDKKLTNYRTPKSSLHLKPPERLDNININRDAPHVLFDTDYEGYLGELDPAKPDKYDIDSKKVPLRINNIFDFDYSKKEPDRCDITAEKYRLLELAFYKQHERLLIESKRVQIQRFKYLAIPNNIIDTVNNFLKQQAKIKLNPDESLDQHLTKIVKDITKPLLKDIASTINKQVSPILQALSTIKDMSEEYQDLLQRINTSSATLANEYIKIIYGMQKNTSEAAKHIEKQISSIKEQLLTLANTVENHKQPELNFDDLQKKADLKTATPEELSILANYYDSNGNVDEAAKYYEAAIANGYDDANELLLKLFKNKGSEVQFTIEEESESSNSVKESVKENSK